jgi:hypothetical protein
MVSSLDALGCAINDAAMRSASRTVAGIVLLMAAGFGLAWLFTKKHSAAAAESATTRPAETAKPAAAEPVAAMPAHRHRTKHPRRGSVPLEAAEKQGTRH